MGCKNHRMLPKTFDPSEIPAKMKFEDIGEHGSMIHGVISWNTSRYGKSF